MLTTKFLLENTDEAIRRLAVKHVDAAPIIEEIRTIDERRRATQRSLDDALAEQNKLSKEIGALMKEGKKDLAEEAKNKVAQLKETTKELEVTKKDLEDKLHGLIVQLPNVPSPEVPEARLPMIM